MILCLLSEWRGKKTLWWGIMFFQISAPLKKAFVRWENFFSAFLIAEQHVSPSLMSYLANTAAVLIGLPLPVHQPREEMVFSGKYKTGEQILRLANERFAVPEMLFHPSDIGIQEMGIPEAIVHSIQSLPEGETAYWLFRFNSQSGGLTNSIQLQSASLESNWGFPHFQYYVWLRANVISADCQMRLHHRTWGQCHKF